MLRGNHECREMTSIHNFKQEILKKFDSEIYDRIIEVFDHLPLAAVIGGKFLAVHGGLSPGGKTIGDFNLIDRFREIPKTGVFCDMLWSDPVTEADGSIKNGFKINTARKCAYFYGKEATKKFLQKNKLISIIRAHEVKL